MHMLSKLAIVANFMPFAAAAEPGFNEALQGAVVKLKQETDSDIVSTWRDDEQSTGIAKAIAYAADHPDLGPAGCFSPVVETYGTAIDRLHRSFDELAAEYDLVFDRTRFIQKLGRAA